METTTKMPTYGTVKSAKISRQAVWSTELVPISVLGAVRSVPAGVDSAAATRRYRTTQGRELPVEMTTTAGSGTVTVPACASNQR